MKLRDESGERMADHPKQTVIPVLPGCILPHLLLAFLLAGCSGALPKIDNLELDKSFTHKEVVAHKMCVGAVVSSDNYLSPEDRARYADLLRRVIQDDHEDYVVLPVAEVEKRVAPGRYEEMLHAYRKVGFLYSEMLEDLEAFSKDFRYLLLARIESNMTTEKTERRPQTDDQGYEIEGKRWVELTTSRIVVVSFDIYDLLQSDTVMSGSIYKRSSRSRAYGEVEDKNILKAFFQTMASTCIQPFAEDLLQPSAPDFEKNLVKIFRGLSNKMP